MTRTDILDPETIRLLCFIEALGDHVIDPFTGFVIYDMRAVSEQLDKARLLIDRAIALRIQSGRDAGGAE